MKNNQALTVYNKAVARFNACKETKADEVVLDLFERNIALAEEVRALTLKISMLEVRSGATVEASSEYAAMMQRMGQVNKASPTVVEQGE